MESPATHAQSLLDAIRRTPMRRGAISKRQLRRKSEIATAIEAEATSAVLAQRVAFQLVFKVDDAELGTPMVWRSIGHLLAVEAACLKEQVGLLDRQIVAVLPKLSAVQVQELFEELQASDRRIARTILNAALQAADPVSASRHYLSEYQVVAEQVHAIDPTVARTLANASFTAATPRRKAMEHVKHFGDLMDRLKSEGICSRFPAKLAFRAADAASAAEKLIDDYAAAVMELLSNGADMPLARMLASSSRFRGHLRTLREQSSG